MNRRRLLAATALAFPLSGCVGRSLDEVRTTTETVDEDVPQQKGGEETVEVQAEAFSPGRIEVNVEGTVHWENTSDSAHQIESTTYTEDAENWSFSKEVPSGETVSKTFDKRGVYQYYDLNAGQYAMCGVVLVGGAKSDWEAPCIGQS
jgi:plastocyanin